MWPDGHAAGTADSSGAEAPPQGFASTPISHDFTSYFSEYASSSRHRPIAELPRLAFSRSCLTTPPVVAPAVPIHNAVDLKSLGDARRNRIGSGRIGSLRFPSRTRVKAWPKLNCGRNALCREQRTRRG